MLTILLLYIIKKNNSEKYIYNKLDNKIGSKGCTSLSQNIRFIPNLDKLYIGRIYKNMIR